MINPHNGAALRGMALLPPTLPVSPFADEAPPEAAAPAQAPTEVSTAGLAFTALASAPIAQATSLLDLIAQPGPPAAPATVSAHDEPTGIEAPAVVTYMPPPIA